MGVVCNTLCLEGLCKPSFKNNTGSKPYVYLYYLQNTVDGSLEFSLLSKHVLLFRKSVFNRLQDILPKCQIHTVFWKLCML